MVKRNDEVILKDIFLRFLQQTEGDEWKVIGENVRNLAGDRTFDYLLGADDSRKTLALVITLLSDDEDDFAYGGLREVMEGRLQETIGPRLHELSGGLVIEIPLDPTGSEIRNLKTAALSVLDAAIDLEPGQHSDVETSIGAVRISCIEGEKSLVFASSSGFGWTNHASDASAMSGMLLRRLAKKNDQLDAIAHRRALLVGMMHGSIDGAAIREALATFEGRFPNIRELYVCDGEDDLERHW
jgi:hypothetical protein